MLVLLILLTADFGPEGGRCPFQGLCHGLLPVDLILQVILTRVAVTAPSYAVETAGKALTVELEALGIAAVASTEVLGHVLLLNYLALGAFRIQPRVLRSIVACVKIRSV